MPKARSKPVSVACPACRGEHSIQCPTCKGGGEDPSGDACCACNGAGEILCPRCLGASVEAKGASRSRAAKDGAKPPKAPPRGDQEFIVSRSSAERFIKQYADGQGRQDARVRVDAIQRFAGYLDQVALTLVAEALRRAVEAKRNTIQPEDFDAAYTVIAGGTANPEGLFASIDKLDTEQLASLVNIITAWLKEKQPGRRP